MRKLGIWLIAALAALAMGCVEAEPDRTNVVIDRTTPDNNTTIVHDSDPTPAPDTDVDINVDTTDDTPDVVIDPK